MRWGSAQSLENSAVYYLERYSANSASLRRVMMRKMRRAAGEAWDAAQARLLLDALITKLTQQGFLDDQKFAEARAASLKSRGTSQRMVAMKLRQKGVDKTTATALASGDDTEAAVIYARRKRLGQFRREAPDALRLQKDLAAMARAGFSYAIAKRVLIAVR